MDKVETLVEHSRSVPVGGRKLVDEQKIRELLDQLRLAVPQDVKGAHELLVRKDGLMQQAQLDARRTRTQAEEEFKARLEESEIVGAAKAKAAEILEDAEKRAQRMVEQADVESRTKRAEADAYALEKLRNLERELTNLLGSVKKGVELLSPPGAAAPR